MDNNLTYYKIFYTVAKAGNISRAAKELYISQPAISKVITKLEQNLSTILFIRNSRGVKLTYEGQLLYEQCKIAFHAIKSGELLVQNATDNNMGHLRIGASTTLCKYILLPYLQEFIMMYPNIKITIECQATYEILSLLENGEIDIGLIAKPEALKNLHYYPVGIIHDIFVASRNYLEKLKADNIPLKAKNILEKGTLMLLDQGNITRQHVDSFLMEQKIQVHNCIEATSLDLLVDFAKIGIGAASVIKEFVCEELKNGSLIEISQSKKIPSREIGFVCPSSTLNERSLMYFLKMTDVQKKSI